MDTSSGCEIFKREILFCNKEFNRRINGLARDLKSEESDQKMSVLQFGGRFVDKSFL